VKILAYLGHPAHFHLLKHSLRILTADGAEVAVLIRKKDILEELLKQSGLEYVNILERRRAGGRIAIVTEMAEREWRMFRFARAFRPDLLVGTSAEIAHVGRLLGKPSIVLNEDDACAVPLFAKAAYPFASTIFSPTVCSAGRWEYKKCGYAGYQKLAYLHPRRFEADPERVRHLYGGRNRFFLLRLVQLTAHHDVGVSGLNPYLVRTLIEKLEPHGRVHISAEGALDPEFEPFRLDLNPLDIHHALYFADLYIGDSQSMAVEAAVLGTPSIRFNDFAGRISVLEELERKYSLTVGIRSSEAQRLFDTVDLYLSDAELRVEWRERRKAMLADKIDVTALLVWLIHDFPSRHRLLQQEPTYQFQIA
jgi:uncharacterized protein